MFYVCCTLLNVPFSFAIILMGKRELIALLSLSSWFLVIVVWLFLAAPWLCLQFVIVVFEKFIFVKKISRRQKAFEKKSAYIADCFA